MATKTERLAIEITANAAGAITQVDRLGKTIDTRLGSADKTANLFSERLDKVGTRLVDVGTKATAAGAAVGAGLFIAAQATQDLADSVDKAQAVFGKVGTESLGLFADGAAEALGKSKAAALDAASAYGLLLKQSGLGGRDLAAQSAALATRTADLAEQFKKPYEEVQKSIEAVLKTGSGKSIKGLLGLDIQIDPESLKGLGAAERTARVLDEIFRQTADSAGFFAKSTDDLGAQIEVAKAKWENAKAAFGEASLPALTSLAQAVTGILELFNQLPAGVQSAIGSFATFGAAIGLVGGPLSSLAGLGAKAFAPLVAQGTKLGGVLASLSGSGAAAAIGGPLTIAAIGAAGVFEAWASETAQVDKQVETLTSSVLSLTDAGQTLPTLAAGLKSVLEVNAGGTDVFAKTGLSVSQVTTAVNAAPGSFDKFRDSVDGLFGVFDNLGGLTSFGDDVGGLREAAKTAGPQVERIVNQLLSLYEAGGISADEFRKTIDYIVDLDKGAANSAKSIGEQAKALRDAAGVASLTGQALADFKIATDPTAKLADQVAALNRLTVAFPQAAAAAGLVPPVLDENAVAADSAGRAITDYASRVAAAADRIESKKGELTLGTLATETTSAARIAINYEQASLRYDLALKKLNETSSKVARNEKVTGALNQVRDAQDGITDAIERRRKAQEKLDELTRKSVVAGSVPLLQEIARAADQGVKDAEARAERVRAEFGAGSIEDAAAQRVVTEARGRRDSSADLLNRGLAEQGGRNQREIRDAQREVQAADRDVAKAVRDKREAEADYQKTLNEGTDDTAERKQALLEFWDASLAKYEAAAALGQAAQDGLDPYGALRDIVTATATASGVAAGQVTSFGDAIDSAGKKAAGALGLIIALLKELDRRNAEAAAAGGSLARREGVPAYQAEKGRSVPGLGGPVGPPSKPPPKQATVKLSPALYLDPVKDIFYSWDGRKWTALTRQQVGQVVIGPGGFSKGGTVPGVGTGDTVLAMLTPGEFVVTKTATAAVGTEGLKALNRGEASIVSNTERLVSSSDVTKVSDSTSTTERLVDRARFDRTDVRRYALGGYVAAAVNQPRKMSEGGSVPGEGVSDTVPAYLTPGEFVLTRIAVSRVGEANLKALNEGTAKVQRFALGGTVRGPASVPASSFAPMQTPARTTTTSTARSVEVSPTINISSTEPKAAAAEVVRKLRRATFLGGVR